MLMNVVFLSAFYSAVYWAFGVWSKCMTIDKLNKFYSNSQPHAVEFKSI